MASVGRSSRIASEDRYVEFVRSCDLRTLADEPPDAPTRTKSRGAGRSKAVRDPLYVASLEELLVANFLTLHGLRPSFPEDEFERQQQQQLAGIGREKVQPVSMAQRVLPRILYGEGHAYSNPLTGSGTEESVGELDVDALRAFHDTWFKPNNATLIVVGDITMGDLLPAVESRFANWEAGDVPEKNLADVEAQPDTLV